MNLDVTGHYDRPDLFRLQRPAPLGAVEQPLRPAESDIKPVGQHDAAGFTLR